MAEDSVEVSFKRTLYNKSSLKLEFNLDTVLIVNGVKVPCNKTILAAESLYFRAMFSSNMKESQQDEIIINDDFNAIRTLVNYMQSSVIKLSEDNVYNVIQAADFLQVVSVRPFCDKFLSSIIKAANCIYIHLFAAQYNYNDVSVKAFHYILENFSDIFKENDFLEAPFSVISEIISSRVLKVESEDQLCYAVRYWINYDIESRHKYLPQLFTFLEIDKVFTWVPLEVDKYLINYGIISKDEKLQDEVVKKLPRKHHSESSTTSKRASPEEVCFAIGGYTIRIERDYVTLCSIEILYGKKCWQFTRPNCLEGIKSFLKFEEETIPTMAHCRSFPAVACSDKLIYVLGGSDESVPHNHFECYDPFSNKWETLPSLPYNLEGGAAAYVNRKIYVTGGYNHNIGINNKVWVFDEVFKSWHEIVSMSVKRSHHCLVAVHGVLYAIGGSGEDGNPLSSVECFFIGSDSWISGEPLLFPRSHFACVVHDDQIYAVCGKGVDSIERYDVSLNKWQYFNKFLENRYGHGATVFKNRLLIIGGRSSVVLARNDVDKLNLNASRPDQVWHTAPYLIRPRVGLVTLTLRLY